MASTVWFFTCNLVGGALDTVRDGLWCWAFDTTSSIGSAWYGARLLIFSGT